MSNPSLIHSSIAQLETALQNFKRIDDTIGGGNNGGMEARVAKLEAHVEHIQTDIKDVKSDVRELRKTVDSDFKILAGMIITGVIGLAGLMAKGFGWL